MGCHILWLISTKFLYNRVRNTRTSSVVLYLTRCFVCTCIRP
jgi:hypothetical protein